MENCSLVFERSTIQVDVAGKIDSVKNPLEAKGFADRLTEHKETIDTVKHAAQRIGCFEAEIANTLSFIVDEKPVIEVIAGDGHVNPSEFKIVFYTKPSIPARADRSNHRQLHQRRLPFQRSKRNPRMAQCFNEAF